jgi:hypothetical protein
VFVSEGARGHIGTLASLARTHSRIKLAEKEWFLAGEFSLACLSWMRSIKYRISPAFLSLAAIFSIGRNNCFALIQLKSWNTFFKGLKFKISQFDSNLENADFKLFTFV